MIDREHFGLYLRNRSFPKYGICARIQQMNIGYRPNSEK